MFLEDVPGGTSICIGADPDCDWQIRAACVPAHAVSALLLSGNLFVRSTCEGDVLLNGSPLGDSWVPVHDGARLDIGFAQIAVALGAARSAFEGVALGTLAYTDAELPAQLATARQHSLSTATRLGFPVWSEPAGERGGGPLAAAPTPRPVLRVDAPVLRVDAQEANDERDAALNRHSRGFAPSLLDEDRRSSSGLWLYVLAGLATLFAYAGWVVVLDRF